MSEVGSPGTVVERCLGGPCKAPAKPLGGPPAAVLFFLFFCLFVGVVRNLVPKFARRGSLDPPRPPLGSTRLFGCAIDVAGIEGGRPMP